MDNQKFIIGVEVGGGHVSAALVTTTGAIVPETTKYFRIDSGGNAEDILNKWALPIKSIMTKVDRKLLLGISFAMPGAFDYKNGLALFQGNGKYDALYNINITEELSDRLNLNTPLPMRYINDATAFAIGACWKGEAQNHERAICFTLGTGIGSAFMEHGVPIVSDSNVPKHGCLWHLPFQEGIVDDYFSTRWFVRESETKYGVRVNGVKSLASAARKHAHTQEIFTKFGHNLGKLLGPWIQQYRPTCLCFGGNISQSADLFGEPFREELHNQGVSVKIAFNNQTEELALVGSTRLYEEKMWDKVAMELPSM
ncbi:MAG: ROK family protein [Marinoscillum sp.]